ncbi:AraC family transcriptional regulator N-terminal domain-containing protein [Amorphus sp. 3PC139-8]|uniref:AraC family transcriptional regulator n=1 Tax=Amorphus sp. 3PC139-8 TaxID=2735676 RepID=UPI00345DA25F
MSLNETATAVLGEYGGEDGYFTTRIPGLSVMKCSSPTRPQCMMYRPSFCLIVQGAKAVTVGDTRAVYSTGQSMVITADGPTTSHIIEATPERPFIGFGLELNIADMREVIDALGISAAPGQDQVFDLFVSETSAAVADCIGRLVDLAERARGLDILLASVMREVYFRLLTGDDGDRIARQVVILGRADRIARVLHYIRARFDYPISIDELSALANMSPSSLHHHFKAVTSMTPLQFQKQLRLIEARRLLVSEGMNVARAAHQVGYESASQFSREYSRMFGLPPARDTSGFFDQLHAAE